jgi:hypothetical protein
VFDHLIRALRDLEGTHEVTVPLRAEPDSDGYIDKECPNKECLFSFKVHLDDWKSFVRDEEVFCPACGHCAPATSWWTTEQIEWAQKAAVAQFSERLDEAMERDAISWNRSQPKNAFVKITLDYKKAGGPVLLPVGATEPMRLKIACNKCQCRFSVIGSAYFCPSCGVNAADHTFLQSLDKIEGALGTLPMIRDALGDRDLAENTANLLIENGVVQAVTAFQRFVETLWMRIPDAAPARRNIFQNLKEGSAHWRTATGKDFSFYLDQEEYASMGRYFQQRHLLAHREGLVDANYIERSGDMAYQIGQRLIIREANVREFISLVRKLGKFLEKDVRALSKGD